MTQNEKKISTLKYCGTLFGIFCLFFAEIEILYLWIHLGSSMVSRPPRSAHENGLQFNSKVITQFPVENHNAEIRLIWVLNTWFVLLYQWEEHPYSYMIKTKNEET